ncbi:NUDIX domain-containing protein [Dactylosporangium cerinum]
MCASCGETTWRNPLPVAVALLPVETDDGRGLVLVRRDIEPMRGELALPGGFIELGETWQEGMVRELREETTLLADPADVRLFDVQSTAQGNLIVFGVLPRARCPRSRRRWRRRSPSASRSASARSPCASRPTPTPWPATSPPPTGDPHP